jgi:hypothetical protein
MPWFVISFGGISVVVFDAIAAIASRSLGFSYGKAAFGSWIIYVVIGYLAARMTPKSSLKAAAFAGLLLGLTDATIGWAVAWIIGPGRVPGGITSVRWAVIALLVTAFSTGIAIVGALIANAFKRLA